MTDKQIMIDGVDVSGCKYYVENNGIEAQGCYELTDLCECNNENEFCDNNSNCYYKQLKAKEQECKKLKEDLIEAKAHGDYLNNLALSKTLDTVSEQLDQLKQTLNEIKEIVSKHYKTEEKLFKIRHSRLPKFSMGALNGRHNLASEILQKISEVINE